MTDLLSSLAKTYHQNSSKIIIDGIPLIRPSIDPEYQNLQQMLKPLRTQLNHSPFTKQLREKSKENNKSQKRESLSPSKYHKHNKNNSPQKNRVEQNLILRCGQNTKNLKVHKSIAENIFREMQNCNYNVTKTKTQNQHQRERSISNNKIKHSPSKPITDQVQDYIRQRESILKSKFNNDPKKENTPNKIMENNHLINLTMQQNQSNWNKYTGRGQQQKKINTTQVNKLQNIRQINKLLMNQSLSSLNISINIKAKIQDNNQQEFNKLQDPDLQQYQSLSQHYRSRSSLGLKSQALQSTQFLQDLKKSPKIKRKRQQSISQSPQRVIKNAINKKLMNQQEASLLENQSIDTKVNQINSIMNQNSEKQSPSRQSVDNKYKRDRRQPSIDMTSSQKQKSRNIGIMQNTMVQKTFQEIMSETGKLSIGGNTQSEFRLTMTPILEVEMPNTSQQTWIQQQIVKEKQKLTKNYSNFAIIKSTNNGKRM